MDLSTDALPVIPNKLCTKCKHCNMVVIPGTLRMQQYNCFNPKNILAYSAIDGSPIFNVPYCIDQREESFRAATGTLKEPARCKVAGDWWEEGNYLNLAKAPAPSVKSTPSGTALADALGM